MRTGNLVEAEVRTQNGHWYLQRIRPFRTGGGGTANAGVAITFTDVTDRKAAEDALRASDERISKLVGLMPAGVYTVDADGLLTYFNQRATELWGRVPVLGDPEQRFCGSLRMWTSDGKRVFHDQCPMADAVHLGLPARNIEVVIEQPSGTRIVADVNIDPLHDREGRLIGAINVFVDVTDRRRAEEAVRRSETTLAAELGAMQRLHEFSIAARATQDVSVLIDLALDALIELQGAAMGNVQLFDGEAGVLRIVAHRGFDSPFLEYFAAVDATDTSACGRAMATRKRVVFADTEQVDDAAFREVARRAGFRAVQSTPLVTVGGIPLGMVSTHFRQPRTLTDAEVRIADILANELSAAIERTRADGKLYGSQTWLEAQNNAFRLAIDGAPLETSLGVLIRAALDESDSARRCAFYIAENGAGTLRHVVGVAESAPHRGACSFPIETSTGRVVGSLAMYFTETREPNAQDRDLARRLTQTAAIVIAHGLRR